MSEQQDRRGSGPTGRLQDKVIIVTGASRGIGAAAGELFAEQGAIVVLASRDESSLQALAKHINASGGTALAVATDVLTLAASRTWSSGQWTHSDGSTLRSTTPGPHRSPRRHTSWTWTSSTGW